MKSKPLIAFSIGPILLIFFIFVFIIALEFNELAGYFPLFLAAGGALLTALSIFLDLLYLIKNKKLREVEGSFGDVKISHDFTKTIINFTWLVSYLLLIFLVGFIYASIIFLFTFLFKNTDMKMYQIIISICIATGGILLLSHFMNLYYPDGLLQTYLLN